MTGSSMIDTRTQAEIAEARFAEIFQNLGSIVRYAAARGSRDPEGIAAEVMTIAWRRLPSLPADDPRPWLCVTARNLLMAERRRTGRQAPFDERARRGARAGGRERRPGRHRRPD